MTSFEHDPIQDFIMDSITNLVNEFVNKPFIFFNEADAVSDLFFRLKNKKPQFNNWGEDNKSTTLLHREYPASCFLKEGNDSTNERKKREKFDLVVLKKEFLSNSKNELKNVTRPNCVYPSTDGKKKGKRGVYCGPKSKPFIAVIEFKLLYESISKHRKEEIEHDIERLKKIKHEGYCDEAYFVYLQRVLKNINNGTSDKIEELREDFNEDSKNVHIINGIWWSDEVEGEGKPNGFKDIYPFQKM
ncbi:MAG: hypothetical protein ABSE00_07790 [Chitinispirillaceae bacterium]|jgi:hypothetical protein